MINKITLTGVIVTAPKTVPLKDGKTVLKFRMANNRYIGDSKSESTYINVDIWNPKIELNINDNILVDGMLKQDEFKTEDGKETSSYYVMAKNIYILQKLKKQNIASPDQSNQAESSK